MSDPKDSGIEKNSRMSYYLNVEKWSGKYASDIDITESKGHSYTLPLAEEWLRWDASAIQADLNVKNYGNIYRKWKKDDAN